MPDPRPVLIVTAVEAEARAIGLLSGARVIAGGIGRTNAACATCEALLGPDRFRAVLSAGVAGALPGSGLAVTDPLVASACIYAEEGLVTRDGFVTLEAIGLSLGDFPGNAVPVDEALLDALGRLFPIGPIATVATCSGTDEAAAAVQARTGALAEAMEGAAVVHAARRLGVPAIELRVMSNLTGDRAHQQWNLPGALDRLGTVVRDAVRALGGR
ncbi:MAG: futalosine hydrolase [Phycisphaeraceae bacterium]|nr:futalosine hydrolase [Phycisphaeraceae bacterium]